MGATKQECLFVHWGGHGRVHFCKRLFLVKEHFCQSAHSKFATNYLNISQSMRSKKNQYLAKVGNVHQGLLQMCIASAVLNENLFCSGSRPEQLNASAKKTCHREWGKPNKGVPNLVDRC